MLVLRHNASEPNKLYAYYTAPGQSSNNIAYGSVMHTAITTNSANPLTWSNNNPINTPLIFGGCYDYSSNPSSPRIDTTDSKPAKGIIYWAKFWDQDLGEKNCNALAAWPHEVIPFYLCGYTNNTDPDRKILDNTNLSFVAAQAVGDRYMYPIIHNSMSQAAPWTGWRESDSRVVCNNRIFKGLPTVYQSIILHTTVNSLSLNINDTNPDTNVKIDRTSDYFYLPAEREVVEEAPQLGTKQQEVSTQWVAPWTWLDANNITNLYEVDPQQASTLRLKTASSIAPLLYRFIGKYMNSSTRIFDINVDLLDSSNVYIYNNQPISVTSGDIWLRNGIGYVYYTNEEIAEGVYVDIVTTNGGWKKADLWGLRTYDPASGFSAESKFEIISDNGTLIPSPANSYRTIGHILFPEFSV